MSNATATANTGTATAQEAIANESIAQEATAQQPPELTTAQIVDYLDQISNDVMNKPSWNYQTRCNAGRDAIAELKAMLLRTSGPAAGSVRPLTPGEIDAANGARAAEAARVAAQAMKGTPVEELVRAGAPPTVSGGSGASTSATPAPGASPVPSNGGRVDNRPGAGGGPGQHGQPGGRR